MGKKLQPVFLKVLWILTLAMLTALSIQAISGNWITYFFILPGGPQGLSAGFIQAMAKLASYHVVVGFVLGSLSVLIPVFTFIHRSSLWVRIFSILALMASISAAVGGYLFVHSGFQDRWSLGQMSDSFVGAYATYFIQLFFMNSDTGFPFRKNPKASNS